jgi:hypothetical protein
MHRLEEFKQMLMRELEDIAKKGELSAGSLDAVDKLTHSIKSICYILDSMEEDEGRSGARGRGRNARRDSMGRYSNDMMYDYDRRNMSGRYSRDKDELMQQLREMEKNADDSEMKHMIKNWIRQVED